jgi:hypothetical protein
MPVEIIAIEEFINNMDSFCVPQDYKHDFEDIYELSYKFRDICIRKKLNLGILGIVEKYNLF